MDKEFKLKLEEKEFIVKIRNLAEQASGSVLLQCGDTLVLGTAVMSENEREGTDFFPLTVDYEERYYAAGKILGSRYIRRESRPSDEAILTARLIDRAIRPRFPKNLKREVQIVITCLSWDKENDPDVIGLIAASLALSISNIPWVGPLATLRIGRKDGHFILNPVYTERDKSDLDLTLTGLESPSAQMLGNKKNDDILINMIEGEGNEIDEKTVLEAVNFAKPYLKKTIEFQKEIIKEVGNKKIQIEEVPNDPELEKDIRDFIGDKIKIALFQPDKNRRMDEVNELRKDLVYFIEEKFSRKGK